MFYISAIIKLLNKTNYIEVGLNKFYKNKIIYIYFKK